MWSNITPLLNEGNWIILLYGPPLRRYYMVQLLNEKKMNSSVYDGP